MELTKHIFLELVIKNSGSCISSIFHSTRKRLKRSKDDRYEFIPKVDGKLDRLKVDGRETGVLKVDGQRA